MPNPWSLSTLTHGLSAPSKPDTSSAAATSHPAPYFLLATQLASSSPPTPLQPRIFTCTDTHTGTDKFTLSTTSPSSPPPPTPSTTGAELAQHLSSASALSRLNLKTPSSPHHHDARTHHHDRILYYDRVGYDTLERFFNWDAGFDGALYTDTVAGGSGPEQQKESGKAVLGCDHPAWGRVVEVVHWEVQTAADAWSHHPIKTGGRWFVEGNAGGEWEELPDGVGKVVSERLEVERVVVLKCEKHRAFWVVSVYG